jgi:hypothetical protein
LALDRCPGKQERRFALTGREKKGCFAKLLLDFRVGEERKLFSRDQLFGRAGCNQYESPSWFALDNLREPSNLAYLSLRRGGPHLDDEVLVASPRDQVGTMTTEKGREIGSGRFHQDIVSLGSILFGDPLKSLPLADNRVG